jgi:Domain of unknown function (DUF4271)
MRRYFFLTLLFAFPCAFANAQQLNDTVTTVRPAKPATVSISDTGITKLNIDSTTTALQPVVKSYQSFVDSLLKSGSYINVNQPSIDFITEKREWRGKEFIFYSLCFVVLILGLFKTFYSSYFNNLFRVFFNTSIRQTQLTDQLLQAKLPSFILNIFFAVSVGFYIWLLFKRYQPPRLIGNQLLLPFCIAGIGALYFIKYCILKFMGWMSGMQQAADNYIFVIFLVNKITGIILIPFIILLAFSTALWTNTIVIFSLLLIGLFFISRYIKTYGVLEYRFPLEPLHFIIYVIAVEILPLLIVYKVVVDYFI